MEFYEFSSRLGMVLSLEELRGLVNACSSGYGWVSVNLGLDLGFTFSIEGLCVVRFGGLRFSPRFEDLVGMLDSLSSRDIIFYDDSTGFSIVEVRSTSFYKLVSVGSGAPTVEIDGIHMHRVKGLNPWDDGRVKVEALGVRRGSRVLDICTGLGYTVLNAIRAGASLVYSIEIDENVLHIASMNPYSRGLESESVMLVLGDAFEVVKELGDSTFHYIIHDPPRFSKKTGELYSIEFYRELYRILKPGGRLYHYTGEPGRVRGFNLQSRISSKLKDVGFIVRGYNSMIAGLIAFKPR